MKYFPVPPPSPSLGLLTGSGLADSKRRERSEAVMTLCMFDQ